METLIKDNGISMKKIFRGMVLLLCCAAMVFTAGCSRKKGGSTAEKNTSDSVAMPGFFAGEEGEPLGLVHIPDMQGDSLQVEFAWSAEDHWVTPDRTKAVYIVVDELVVYDFTRDLKDYDFINDTLSEEMTVLLARADGTAVPLGLSECFAHLEANADHPGGREIRALPGLLRLLDKASSRV